MKSHSSTNTYSSSSSSSSWLSFTTGEKRTIHPTALPKYYHSSLHSVRKPPPPAAKLTKKPIAPIPPIPPRVYSVDPLQFKQVVQMLTAEPEFQSQRLQKLAPPPLALNQITVPPPPPQQQPEQSTVTDDHVINHPVVLSNHVKKIKATSIWNTETLETKNSPSGGWFGLLSPLSNGWSGLLSPLSNGWSGFLSPLSNGWTSFPVLSPGMNTSSTTSFSLQVFPDL